MDREGGNKERMRKCREWISLHFLILSSFSRIPNARTQQVVQPFWLLRHATKNSGNGWDLIFCNPYLFSGKNSWKSQNEINTSKVFLVNLLVFPSQLQGEDPPAETKSHFWPQFFLDGAPNESSLLVVTSLQIWRGVFVRVLTYRHNKRKYAKIKTMMMELVLTRHTDDSCSWSGCDCPHTSLRCLLHPI